MRAINSGVMKDINRKMVLDSIRRSSISRAELSDKTRLTRASITQIVDGLMNEGLVVETSTVDRQTPGRRQTRLALVKEAIYIAGAYCGRDGYDMGVMDLGGNVIWRDSGVYGDNQIPGIMDEIAAKLQKAMDDLCPIPGRLYGLSACLPSPVEKNQVKAFQQPDAWKKRNEIFAGEMKKRLGWDIYIGNINNAYALDELYFGIGKDGADNFMVLRVDDSVGAGFIINNHLFMGARGFSPEIGHITLKRDGPRCICGNRGCMELFLAIPHVLKETPFSKWSEVVDCKDEDPVAEQLFKDEVELLAFEIMNLANVMDLDKVVITGDLVYGGNSLCERIMRFMNERFVNRMGEVSIVPSKGVDLGRIACMPAYHSIFA